MRQKWRWWQIGNEQFNWNANCEFSKFSTTKKNWGKGRNVIRIEIHKKRSVESFHFILLFLFLVSTQNRYFQFALSFWKIFRNFISQTSTNEEENLISLPLWLQFNWNLVNENLLKRFRWCTFYSRHQLFANHMNNSINLQ